MILCLTPNPAIDRTMYVDSLTLGEVHRAQKVLMAAGGKGLNVARTIRTLGGEPLCMGPLGGYTGRLLTELARQEGFTAQWTQVKNETRTCVILVEAGKDSTVINEAGQGLVDAESERLIEDVLAQTDDVDTICISGSLPNGFSQMMFKGLLYSLVKIGKPVWVDTSGIALRTALGVAGVHIKVNASELGEALDTKITNEKEAAQVAKSLHDKRAGKIAVTLGKLGAVLVTEHEAWFAESPEIKTVSSVGSGDAFLGGLLFAEQANHSAETILQYAAAAGAANALHFGGGIFIQSEFDEILSKIKSYRLS